MKKTCKNCKYGDPNKRIKWYVVTWCHKLHTTVQANKNRDRCMHYKKSEVITMDRYGYCECGAPLVPIWFTEEERNKHGVKTGRKRIACSHLLCEYCGKIYPVDDTFDKPWR